MFPAGKRMMMCSPSKGTKLKLLTISISRANQHPILGLCPPETKISPFCLMKRATVCTLFCILLFPSHYTWLFLSMPNCGLPENNSGFEEPSTSSWWVFLALVPWWSISCVWRQSRYLHSWERQRIMAAEKPGETQALEWDRLEEEVGDKSSREND